jgi:hypothetical protein
VAAATADLAAAPSAAARAAALMRRARASFAAAQKMRAESGGPFGRNPWPPERERFVAHCELAIRDFGELLGADPGSPDAAEAIFTIGQINDYPYLNVFDDALVAYRLTVERHPGTPWAAKAAERIAVIQGFMGAGGGPHGAPAP